jgi:hypothetical protein
VVAAGRSASVPGLLGLDATSVIACSDCHASDQPAAGAIPRGPHGSSEPHLLAAPYATIDPSPYTGEGVYGLCFRCHDPKVLFSAQTGFRYVELVGQIATTKSGHARHVQDMSVACSVCHNSHGVSSLAGNARNNAHLVDFDVNVVKASTNGLREYVSTGPAAGNCTVACHSVQHDAMSYGPIALPRISPSALRSRRVFIGK